MVVKTAVVTEEAAGDRSPKHSEKKLTLETNIWTPFKKWASLVARRQRTSLPAGDVGSVPGSGRSPGEGNGNPLQDSCLGNPTTAKLGRLQSWDHKKVRHDLATKQQQQFKKKVRFHPVLYGSLCVFWEMSLYNLTIINKHLLISYQVQGNILAPGGKMKYKTNSKHLFNQED